MGGGRTGGARAPRPAAGDCWSCWRRLAAHHATTMPPVLCWAPAGAGGRATTATPTTEDRQATTTTVAVVGNRGSSSSGVVVGGGGARRRLAAADGGVARANKRRRPDIVPPAASFPLRPPRIRDLVPVRLLPPRGRLVPGRRHRKYGPRSPQTSSSATGTSTSCVRQLNTSGSSPGAPSPEELHRAPFVFSVKPHGRQKLLLHLQQKTAQAAQPARASASGGPSAVPHTKSVGGV